MKKNELEDKALDEILYYAAPLAEQEMMDEFEDCSNENIEFSKEHEEKMQKLFKAYRQKQLCKKIFSISKRAAIFLIIISIIGAVSVLSVEAWRIKILNFIIEVRDNHSDISLKEKASKNNSYKTEDIDFEYIPEGFSVQDTKATKSSLFIQFTDKNNLYFSLDVRDANGQLSIDTENADVKKIIINGEEALLSEKNNVKILVWHNDQYTFTLTGNIETSEIIKVAEGLKK